MRERIDINRYAPPTERTESTVRGSRARWWAKLFARLLLIFISYGILLYLAGAGRDSSEARGLKGLEAGDPSWWHLALSIVILGICLLLAGRPVRLLSRFLGRPLPTRRALLLTSQSWLMWIPVALLSVLIMLVSHSVNTAKQAKAGLSGPPTKAFETREFPDGREVQAFFDESRRPKFITISYPDGTADWGKRNEDGTWANTRGPFERQERTIRAGWAGAIWMFIIVAVLAPILEEIIFRGLLFTLLLRWLGVLGAGIASAMLFFVMHIPKFSSVTHYAGPAALLFFCYLLTSLLLRTKRLRYCILFHSLMNATVLAIRAMC